MKPEMKPFKIHKAFTQSGNSIAVVIPMEYAKELGIEDGTYVRVTERNGQIIIEKINGYAPTIIPEIQVKEA